MSPFLASICQLCLAALLVSGALCIHRLVVGPDVADRAVALDTLTMVFIGVICTLCMLWSSALYFDGWREPVPRPPADDPRPGPTGMPLARAAAMKEVAGDDEHGPGGHADRHGVSAVRRRVAVSPEVALRDHLRGAVLRGEFVDAKKRIDRHRLGRGPMLIIQVPVP